MVRHPSLRLALRRDTGMPDLLGLGIEMTCEWIRQEGKGRLILFLNGWGMDGGVVSHMGVPAGWDLLMVYDYTRVAAVAVPGGYERVVMVAWSMGVWAAGVALAGRAGEIDRAVAINGTGCPIDERLGIAPSLYRGTMEGFSALTRDSFYRRMCGSGDKLNRFMQSPPARGVEDQGRELEGILEQAAGQDGRSVYPFDEVLIGAKDRIMRPENQQRFWEERAPCRVVEMPHYPFFDVTWEALIGEGW